MDNGHRILISVLYALGEPIEDCPPSQLLSLPLPSQEDGQVWRRVRATDNSITRKEVLFEYHLEVTVTYTSEHNQVEATLLSEIPKISKITF